MKLLQKLQANVEYLKSYLRLFRQDNRAYQIVKQVRDQKLTYLEPAALADIYERVKQVEENQLDGVILEAGCALGGSALVISFAKGKNRPFLIFDAFEMIPPPSESDGEDAHKRYEQISSGQATGIKGGTYYGYQDNLLDQVQETFKTFELPPDEYHVDFIQGYYENALHVDQPIAFAHIDCDWYDSVITCLERIEPYLVSGGVMVIDDYNDWSGCKKAVDTYFAERGDEFEFEMKSRLHIIRK